MIAGSKNEVWGAKTLRNHSTSFFAHSFPASERSASFGSSVFGTDVVGPREAGRLLKLPVITRIGYDRLADLIYAWNRWRGHW